MTRRRSATDIAADPIKPARSHHPGTARWAEIPGGDWGPLYVAFGERGVREVSFEPPPHVDPADFARRVPRWLRAPFEAYFRRKPVDFREVPLDLRGTPFQRSVWEALRAIPWGHVESYGAIARRVGSPRAMRAVGMANGANPVPILVPCHRVVEAGGKLGGFSGGLDKKRALLAIEGVVIENGHVLPGQLDLFGDRAA